LPTPSTTWQRLWPPPPQSDAQWTWREEPSTASNSGHITAQQRVSLTARLLDRIEKPIEVRLRCRTRQIVTISTERISDLGEAFIQLSKDQSSAAYARRENKTGSLCRARDNSSLLAVGRSNACLGRNSRLDSSSRLRRHQIIPMAGPTLADSKRQTHRHSRRI
jgi:hypothetical protein